MNRAIIQSLIFHFVGTGLLMADQNLVFKNKTNQYRRSKNLSELKSARWLAEACKDEASFKKYCDRTSPSWNEKEFREYLWAHNILDVYVRFFQFHEQTAEGAFSTSGLSKRPKFREALDDKMLNCMGYDVQNDDSGVVVSSIFAKHVVDFDSVFSGRGYGGLDGSVDMWIDISGKALARGLKYDVGYYAYEDLESIKPVATRAVVLDTNDRFLLSLQFMPQFPAKAGLWTGVVLFDSGDGVVAFVRK